MPDRRWVVLDRDGTIIQERHYLSEPGQVELIPGVAKGLRQLEEMGLGLVVITNQSGIGRGYFDRARLELIHQRLGQLLEAEGVYMDGIYFCPHIPEDDCLCRKPKTGLLELAAKELNFDPRDCLVVGDKASDIKMGQRVGATTMLVRTGYGTQVYQDGASTPDYVVGGLLEAAQVAQRMLTEKEVGVRSDVNDQDRVREYLLESATVKQRVSEKCTDSIITAAGLIAKSFRAGGKVLLCGNGGSAADCQHLATEFVSRLTKDFERPGLPAIALTTDTSFLTAFSNDCGFEDVFARQVQALGNPEDLLMGISTSGCSTNVVRAAQEAKNRHMAVIILTGENGPLADMGDVAISVPSTDTQHIQEAHIAIEHILCALVEQDMFGKAESGKAAAQ